MSYTFKQNMVSTSKHNIKCPYTMDPIGFCVHNTYNDASAENEIKYMISNGNQVSYHYAVDEKYVIQGLPTNRNAWAAGDGSKGTGNRKYIHIEICRSTGDEKVFKQCEQNCAEFLAKELKARGWTIKQVKKHQDFADKRCPHKTLDLGWQRFLDMVQNELNKLNNVSKPVEKPVNPVVENDIYTVRITADILNVRKGPAVSYNATSSVNKGQVFTIVQVQNGWGKLKSGAGWINLSYTEKITVSTSNVFKVKINTASLNVRKGPGAYYDIALAVTRGQVFTIVETKNGWGKLKSGAGWINLSYTEKVK